MRNNQGNAETQFNLNLEEAGSAIISHQQELRQILTLKLKKTPKKLQL